MSFFVQEVNAVKQLSDKKKGVKVVLNNARFPVSLQ